MIMKKILIASLIVLLASCTSDGENPSEANPNIESIHYTLDGKTLKVDFEVTETDELIVLEDKNSILVDHFISENENYIEYVVDDANIILFRNDLELHTYLQETGNPLRSTKNESATSAKSFPFTSFNLELYYDCCYDSRKRFDWISNCAHYLTGDGLQEMRLDDFTSTAWSSSLLAPGQGPVICHYGDRPISTVTNRSNPNDIMESVLVRDAFARFYEDINHRGSSIVLDARNGEVRGFRKLRQVRNGLFGKNWRDRISSIKLSN